MLQFNLLLTFSAFIPNSKFHPNYESLRLGHKILGISRGTWYCPDDNSAITRFLLHLNDL